MGDSESTVTRSYVMTSLQLATDTELINTLLSVLPYVILSFTLTDQKLFKRSSNINLHFYPNECLILFKNVIILFIEPLLSNIKHALMKTKSESLLFYFSINLDNSQNLCITCTFILGLLI